MPRMPVYPWLMEFTIFDTALGHFALGWTERGVARLSLPGESKAAIAARFGDLGALPGQPDRRIDAVLDRIEDYAEGEPVDFADCPLDIAGVPDFHRRCYEKLMDVRWGQTVTYGDLARHLGDVNLSRAVGQAMGANPIPVIIPCHRVLASDGRPGGFSAPGGATAKVRMLALEGVHVGTPAGQMSFGF